MIKCTRIIEFDAAHRVKNHESKCRHLHGHRYSVQASFVVENQDGLDKLGRVIDFGVIKEKLGAWIDDNWDHNTILFNQDKQLGELIESQTGQSVFYLPYNPTAENMAAYLFYEICPEIFKDEEVDCVHIKLYETPNCFVEVADSAV